MIEAPRSRRGREGETGFNKYGRRIKANVRSPERLRQGGTLTATGGIPGPTIPLPALARAGSLAVERSYEIQRPSDAPGKFHPWLEACEPMDGRPSYDEKLLAILQGAASVFAEKGYHQASIRDISGATGVSLSGLYYYFSSKEELLFLIQEHCFSTLIDHLKHDLQGEEDPEQRLRLVVRNHLGFFVDNMREMKVLSHESDVLTGKYREQILDRKRDYVRIVKEILKDLSAQEGPELRTATFGLFGMMNWIYTWYNPEKDLPVDRLEEEILHLFLNGFSSPRRTSQSTPPENEERARPASIWRRG